MTDFHPRDAADIPDIMAAVLSRNEPVALVGRDSKPGLGRPVQAPHRIALEAFNGVTLYEHDELVLSARAGTPLSDIAKLLAEHGQQLAFEPPDWGPLYGRPADSGSLGGAIACNLSGSRRLTAGAARDHFLGFSAVSGRGEAFKGGSRVVKNVTGYDLPKLLAGSHGTLAIMTDVTVKVLPRPETARTLLLLGLDDGAAIAALATALNAPYEISGAAHLPADAVPHFQGLPSGQAVTALRIEGFGPSVEARCTELRGLLGGAQGELDQPATLSLWKALGDGAPFAAQPGLAVWRISVPPSEGPAVAAHIGAMALTWFDWAGGLIWVGIAPGEPDAGAARVRAALGATGGHATCLRAPDPVRAALSPFQPMDDGLAALTRRVKDSFDPLALLNPGRT